MRSRSRRRQRGWIQAAQLPASLLALVESTCLTSYTIMEAPSAEPPTKIEQSIIGTKQSIYSDIRKLFELKLAKGESPNK